MKRKLAPAEIADISSTYLVEGRKKESWELTDIEVEDAMVRARVRMTSTYASPTDAGRFHLTIFSALEFLSQLMIIYMHVWNGYTRKTLEGWMIESQVTSRRAIRDPDDIRVEMEIKSIRNVRGSTLLRTFCRVTDGGGGLFEAKLKGLLSKAASGTD
jgi:hypothetical protein